MVTIGNRVHPALRIVTRSEELWTADKAQAVNRAAVVVCTLIQCGLLAGRVQGDIPLAPDIDQLKGS